MNKFVFLVLMLSSFLVMACEDSIQGAGGSVTDGFSSSKPSGLSGNSLSRGFASSSSGDASIDCEIGRIIVSGVYPGPGWSSLGGSYWIYNGVGGGGGSGNGNPDPDPDPEDCTAFDNAALCVAATVGGTGGFLALLETAACGSCMTVPNPASCATCAAILGVSAIILSEAIAGACAPNEDIPPGCFD